MKYILLILTFIISLSCSDVEPSCSIYELSFNGIKQEISKSQLDSLFVNCNNGSPCNIEELNNIGYTLKCIK